jgi:hypothetical protein
MAYPDLRDYPGGTGGAVAVSRCRLSDKKVRREVRPLVPAEYVVAGAMVRGGGHLVLACLLDGGKRFTADVDRKAGTCEIVPHYGWSFADESELERSIAYINEKPSSGG